MSNMLQKSLYGAAAIGIVILAIFMLKPQFMDDMKSEGDIKIGMVMGLTGPIPDLVKPMADSAQIAISQVNEQGGILGGTLVVPLLDGQCGPQTAVDAVEKLINVEQVAAIVGEVCSGATIAAAETVAVPAGVTMVSPSASSPAITTLNDNDLLFRTAPSDAYQGVALAKFALENGMTSVAMTYANDDYNVGIATVFRDAFVKAGGTIVGDQVHEPEKSSYRAELATLAGRGASTLAIFSYYNSGGTTLLRQSLEMGTFDNYIGADGMAAQAMVDEIGGANLKGISWWTANTVEVENPSYLAFADILKDAGYDYKPEGPFLATSYDAMFLAALAVEKNGSTDRAGVSAALREVASAPGEIIRPGEWKKAADLIKAGKAINYEGASGSLDFDPAGDVQGVYSVNIVNDAGELYSAQTVR
ncbi:MAG: ABC transporter substrate-binding protein [Alphaproteobacteria bacterium]